MLSSVANAIEEGELVLDGVRVFYRHVPGEGTPTVYCHGNPTHGEDWVPFMQRGGPSIAIDMPGWGRSDHPDSAHFDYSMYGLSAFLERCLDELGIGQRKLVVHDWGCARADRRPAPPRAGREAGRHQRRAAAPRLPLALGGADLAPRGRRARSSTRRRRRASMALTMRQARGDRSSMPPEFVDMVWQPLGQGHQRRHPCPLPARRPRSPRLRGQLTSAG